MREFDRIVQDYQKLNGIPHFQETNITVSEIVKLVMAGKSNDDILAQYPVLSAGDIQEALAFAVRDLVVKIGFWKYEGLDPLTGVIGYGSLLEQGLDTLTAVYQDNLPELGKYIRKMPIRVSRPGIA